MEKGDRAKAMGACGRIMGGFTIIMGLWDQVYVWEGGERADSKMGLEDGEVQVPASTGRSGTGEEGMFWTGITRLRRFGMRVGGAL